MCSPMHTHHMCVQAVLDKPSILQKDRKEHLSDNYAALLTLSRCGSRITHNRPALMAVLSVAGKTT